MWTRALDFSRGIYRCCCGCFDKKTRKIEEERTQVLVKEVVRYKKPKKRGRPRKLKKKTT